MPLLLWIERAKGMVLNPHRTWEDILEEDDSIGNFFVETILPMAALPAAAHLLGFWYHGFFDTVFKALLWFILAVAGVWLVGKTVHALALYFNSSPNEIRAFQLAAYSFLPFFLSGVCYILPFLSFIVFLSGLYGIYLLFVGLPVLLNMSGEKSTVLGLIAGAAMLAVIVLVGELTGGVLWPSKP